MCALTPPLGRAAQIGLPPVLHFGSAALKARVAPECLQVRLPQRVVARSRR
jgi:hypothetical protein